MNVPQPPRLADRLLALFCAPHLLEAVQGDLHEEFAHQVERLGERRARWWYWREVLGFIRPFALKRRPSETTHPSFFHHPTMLRNYLLTAFRTLWRSKLYSALNIGGLAVGLAVSLLILLFVVHEVTYDRFHAHADRIFRVYGKFKYGEQEIQTPAMSAAFGPAVQRANPDVVDFVRTGSPLGSGRVVVSSSPDQKAYETDFLFADPSLLTVFSFPLVAGDPKTALARPMTVLLTERMAEKYFGRENPVGKTLVLNGKHRFEVTGVLKNPPSNSTLDFNFVASMLSHPVVERASDPLIKDDELALNNPRVQLGAFQTYFLLKNREAVGRVTRSVAALVKATGGESQTSKTTFFFDPLTAVHLGGANFGDTANARYVTVFGAIALAILLLALLNYMSLTTARATQRAKEVGVRKALGAFRRELAAQFYGESVLTTALAFGLALLLVRGLQPVFYNLLQLHIDTTFLYSPVFLLTVLGLLAVCVLLAGSYPALLLSAFKPVSVLRGRLSAAGGGAWVRRGFTTLQFAVSVALIGCSMVVQRQLDFLRNQNLGLRKDRVLVVPVGRDAYAAVKERLRHEAGIERVAAASQALYDNGYSMFFTQSPKTKEEVGLYFLSVDENFLPLLGIPWRTPPTDLTELTVPNRLVINESAARKLGIARQPLGQEMEIGAEKNKVVGVVRDFHFTSLHQKIEPLGFWVSRDTARAVGSLYLRISPRANLPEVVARVEKIYALYRPEAPFTYSFLDQNFDALYKAEDRLARMFGAFTGFAVFIACLGLFGLATFTAERRTKEIGVRKVLGASAASVVALLSRDFLKLVLLAIALATPVAYYAMRRWLEGFAYKINLEWWVFAAAGLLAVAVALLTVSFQSIKAALMNPVKSLRSE
jgi:putative ABC transport system permease protein